MFLFPDCGRAEASFTEIDRVPSITDYYLQKTGCSKPFSRGLYLFVFRKINK